MNWQSAVLWGFVATLVLTSLLAACKELGITRMDIPFLLGTMFTGHRDRASWVGYLVHLLNGWVFALVYIAAFHSIGKVSILFGMVIGFVHSWVLLAAGMDLLPYIHPRMATDDEGPDVKRFLEPPGFLALNYGRRTPIVTVVAHLIYGGILGYFYSLAQQCV